MKRIICILMILALMLCACGQGESAPTAASTDAAPSTAPTETTVSSQEPAEESAPAFSQMEYVRPDPEAVLAAQTNCETLAQSQDFEQLNTAFGEYLAMKDTVSTMNELSRVYYYTDTSNAQWKTEHLFCSEGMTTIKAGHQRLLTVLAASTYAAKLEEIYLGEGFLKTYEGKENLWSEELQTMLAEDTRLQNEYATLTTPGQQGELLVELVKLRHKIAAAAGYDTYPEFAYVYYNEREYTPEDARVFIEEVRMELAPLCQQFKNETPPKYSSEDAMAYLKTIADNAGGVISDAYTMMTERELYDIKFAMNKMSIAMCTYLKDYDVPFLFVQPMGSSAITLVHEFGHFCHGYGGGGKIPNVDTAEVFSQAMEYLSLSYGTGEINRAHLISLLSVYVLSTAQADFEVRLYDIPEEELTPEAIDKLYSTVAGEWGMAYHGMSSYTSTSHFYTSPLYVLSYAVSNDVALQMYAMELAEPGSGMDLYKKCITISQPQLLGFVETVGLNNPLESGRAKAARETFEKAFEQFS